MTNTDTRCEHRYPNGSVCGIPQRLHAHAEAEETHVNHTFLGTDTRCLTCGHDEGEHADYFCDECAMIEIMEGALHVPAQPHHPFVPAPSTTDAVETARRVLRGHWFNPDGAWSNESFLASLDGFEAAIVARERERYEAHVEAVESIATRAAQQLIAREALIEALTAVVRLFDGPCELAAPKNTWCLTHSMERPCDGDAVRAALDKEVQP